MVKIGKNYTAVILVAGIGKELITSHANLSHY